MKSLDILQRTAALLKKLCKALCFAATAFAAYKFVISFIIISAYNIPDDVLLLLLFKLPKDFIAEGVISFVESLDICGYVLVFNCAYNYFSHQIKEGTPFTRSGATIVLRLGMLATLFPAFVWLIGYVFAWSMGTSDGFEFDINISMMISGVLIVLMSLLLKHGAEIQEKLNSYENK